MLLVPLACAAAPSLLKLPMFDGEVSGELALFRGNVDVRWRVVAESPPEEPGVRRGRLELSGHGAQVAAVATLDLKSGVTRWKIEKAEADLAELFPALSPHLLPDFAHLFASGRITAEGGGEVTADGSVSGALAIVISDASVRDFFGGWAAEGLDARIELPALPALTTAPGQHLALRRFTHASAGVEIRDTQTDIGYGSDGRIHLSNTKTYGYGGLIEMAPFALNPLAPEVSTRVRIENIDSESLAAFLPGSIAETHGRFSGDLALSWSPETGVVPGDGKLELVKAPGTAIRLSKAPGFFTANMLPRIYFLPDSLGFLQRWFSIKNPAYDVLQKIERGESPIMVDAITINFTPDGDELGRSASVVIAARPADAKSAVKNLRINVNVTGPITKVLEMSTTDRVQIGF